MTSIIVCPTCGRRLCDANSQVVVKTKIKKITTIENEETNPADYYIKCWNCKTTVGIKKD